MFLKPTHLHGTTNGTNFHEWAGMATAQCSPLRLSLFAEVVCSVGCSMGWRVAVTGLSEPGYNGGDERGVVMPRWRCPMEVPNGGGGRGVSGGQLSDNERRLVQGYFCGKNYLRVRGLAAGRFASAGVDERGLADKDAS